ncbi:MAG TPA: DMT family transporter [Gaiellaceae bacterium]
MTSEAAVAPRSANLAAPLAALTAVTLWASAFVGIRSAGHHFSPGALALGRLLVGTAVLSALALYRREALPQWRDLRLILLCGVLWFATYSVVLNAAERRVDAGTASLLTNTGPILIAVLAGVLLGEGFPRKLIIGCAVAFIGAAVIGAATSKSGIAPSWGAILCVFAAAAYAGGVVSQKPALARVSPLTVTWLACTTGMVVCLPFMGQLVHDTRNAPASSIGWVAYLGAGPLALGFLAWAFALRRSTAGRLGVMTYLVPPIAILMGWGLLGEVPPRLAFVGGAVCLAGVALSRR